jgi:hypothetical protein
MEGKGKGKQIHKKGNVKRKIRKFHRNKYEGKKKEKL